MKYVVISLSGQEFKVKEGDLIKVNKLEKFEPKVLLFSDGAKVEVGKPTLDEVKIQAEIVSQEKGKKIVIRRFKAKSRYHKTRGFRPLISNVKIISIGGVLKVSASPERVKETSKSKVERVVKAKQDKLVKE